MQQPSLGEDARRNADRTPHIGRAGVGENPIGDLQRDVEAASPGGDLGSTHRRGARISTGSDRQFLASGGHRWVVSQRRIPGTFQDAGHPRVADTVAGQGPSDSGSSG